MQAQRVVVVAAPPGVIAATAAPSSTAAVPSTHVPLMNTLYRHGLLLDDTSSRTVSRAGISVSTTSAQPASPPMSAPRGGSESASGLLPASALHVIERGLPLLFPMIPPPTEANDGKPVLFIPCDFLRLVMEVLRVIRDFASPVHTDVIAAAAPSAKPSTGGSTAIHILSRYARKVNRVSDSVRILAATLWNGKAQLSDRDASMIIQLADELTNLLLASLPAWNVSDARRHEYAKCLGSLWWCMEANCVAMCRDVSGAAAMAAADGAGTAAVPVTIAAQDVAAVCVSTLRSLGSQNAWLLSGSTLFLAESYLMSLVSLVIIVVSSATFQKQFDNTTDAAAKLLVERVAQRPPLTKEGCTSARSPTPTHGVTYLYRLLHDRCGKYTEQRLEAHQYRALAAAVKSHLGRQDPQAISFFHWALLATMCREVPLGATLEPQELLARMSRTAFADPSFAPAVEVSLLQLLAILTIQYAGVPREYSTDVLSVWFDVVAKEVLQLGASSVDSLKRPVQSVQLREVLFPVLRQCESDPDLLLFFLPRLTANVKHAFQVLLEASLRPATSSNAAAPSAWKPDTKLAAFCLSISSAYWPFMTIQPQERLSTELAVHIVRAMGWLLPLYTVYADTIEAPPKSAIRAAASSLRRSMEAWIHTVSSRLGSQDADLLLREAISAVSQTSRISNLVYSARLEALLLALRAPAFCAAMTNQTVLKEWGHAVLPCLYQENLPSVPLMLSAHDALIAPVLAKKPGTMLFIPTYVAMFCPLQCHSSRYRPPPNAVLRRFATQVRLVAQSLEEMDSTEGRDALISTSAPQNSPPHQSTAATAAAANTPPPLPSVASSGEDTFKELHTLSAILLIVQGTFDNVQCYLKRRPLTNVDEERKNAYLSALLNLLQCSNPLVTSRVCACVEVAVLDLLADQPAESERLLSFVGKVVQSTTNYSVKQPLGDWLLRLADTARRRRVGRVVVRSKL